MNRLSEKLAMWFRQRSARAQRVIVNIVFSTLIMLAFILSLVAEQRIIAP